MNRRLFISILLTLIAVAAFAQLALSPPFSGIPLNITPRGKFNYVIAPVPSIPLPPGLHNGDELEMQQMPPAMRAALLLSQPATAGVTIDVMVQRGDRVIAVPVTTQYLPNSLVSQFAKALFLRNAMLLAILALGLLAIWRGRNLAALGLGLFAIAIIISTALRSIAVPIAWVVWMELLVEVVVVPFIFLGLFLVAHAVIGNGMRVRVKTALTTIFALIYLTFVVLTFTRIIGLVYFGLHTLPTLVLPVLVSGLGLIPFLLLVLGYTRASPEQRLRIRWILCSTGVIFLALILGAAFALNSNPAYQLVLDYLQILLFTAAVAGYTYAVLRHRLVDVRIVLNRTLVYGAITAIVVGIFAAINALVERETLGHGASLILELIVPLALGIVLSTLRKQIDGYINRFLFRRQYQAEKALNNFARTCGFIEQPEHLLDLTVQEVFLHSNAQSVALYERNAQGYQRVRQQGSAGFPARVEADDLAFVRLRAGDSEADLHELASTLGTQGYVFSMAVRGKLIGALVCGPRPAEQYTADERALLSHVARQAGAALHALRGREHEKFVDLVANGALDATSAREQARQLVAVWQTA